MTALPYSTSSFASVTPEPVRWLLRGRIPVGKIVGLEGDAEAGKSSFAIWLAARVATGDLGTLTDLIAPASVIMISAEDGVEDTLRPRLEQQRADVAALDRVHKLNEDDLGEFSLPEGLGRLEATIRRLGARLVIIDPLASFLGARVAVTSDSSLRRAIGPLRRIAEEHEVTIMIIRHLNGRLRAPANRRGLGGVVPLALARAVLALGLHPDDGGDPTARRVLAMTKCNLAGRATRSIVLSMNEQSRLMLGEEIDLSADELLANAPRRTPGPRSTVPDATVFIRDQLNGHEMLVTDLLDMALAAGFSRRTFRRARDEMGLRPRRAQGRWWMSLEWTRDNTPEPPPNVEDDPEEPPASGATPSPTIAGTGSPPPRQPTPTALVTPGLPVERADVDDMDDTAKRMSLLELDDVPMPATPGGTLAASTQDTSRTPTVPRPASGSRVANSDTPRTT